MERSPIRRLVGCLFALLLAVCAAAPVAAAGEKLAQELEAAASYTVPATRDTFSLSELAASSNAEDARLTYSVELGGDVIRVEGDAVAVVGWGQARIRVRADETARYRAAERTVDIQVVKDPEIRLTPSAVTRVGARIDATVAGGSYTTGELRDWFFGYRPAGDGDYTPIPIDWPGYDSFYFFAGSLAAGQEYEILASASYTDRITGEQRVAEGTIRFRTSGGSGGTLSGTVTGGPGGGRVSLWRGNMLVTAADAGGGTFTLSGVPDGSYRLAAESGGHTVTKLVEVSEGQATEPLDLAIGPVGSAVRLDGGIECLTGLDILTSAEPESEEAYVEYRLAARRLEQLDESPFQDRLEERESIGLCLEITLERTVTGPGGIVLERERVAELPEALKFQVALPEDRQSMDSYRVLGLHGGTVFALGAEYDVDTGVLSFETDKLSLFAVVGAEAVPPAPAEQPTVTAPAAQAEPEPVEPAPPQPELEPEPVPPVEERSGGWAAAVVLVLVAGVAVAALILVRRRRNVQEQPDVIWEEPPVEPEEPEPPPEPQISEEERKAIQRRLLLYPSGKDPAQEERFFQAIEERKELKTLYDQGELKREEFKEKERDILLHM